jgi:very-short-patch-repair endonuclease/type I restriction-modification system DNA methylase subunit
MTPTVNIKPTHKAIQTYHQMILSYAHGNVTHETGIRTAFIRLLEDTAKLHDWLVVTELSQKVQGHTIRPDATLSKNAVPRGYYEAKDTNDDLDAEIRKKSLKGYPLTNIIFEDSKVAVLYQGKREVYRVPDMSNSADLAHLLNTFFGYSEPVLENYDQALDQFSETVPRIAENLVDIIGKAHSKNKAFQTAFTAFYELCKTSLNPNISTAAVDEMLVQHLLTERLIRRIFDNPEFTNRNVIAVEIEKVITALAKQSFSRDEFLRGLDTFYQAIELAAHGLEFSQKQTLLNEVYERFFQGYSIKIADTHGIVYTPQPIVDFMCASVVEVLQTEFGKTLGDEDVVILDPATGTGNFIVNLLRRADKADLPDMYNKRLYANEIMLLPYYIAALNIEHAYYDLTGKYEPFEGLCFVDTLDIAEGRQTRMAFMTEQNSVRVERQKKAPITVIIGNPPYNVGQVNENDNNKNRSYEIIDKRIKETYAKDSKATSVTKIFDPYVKFFRWAVDRLQGSDGIVCYVTNNSFVDQIAFDGMRKHLMQDFTRIFHVDLHGNVRQNPKLSGSTHNVFGIQVGVGITLAVKASGHGDHKVYYHRVPEFWRKEEKLAWLGEMGRIQPSPQPSPPTPLPQGEGSKREERQQGEGIQPSPPAPLPQGEGSKRDEGRQQGLRVGGMIEARYKELAAKAIVQIGRDLRQRQTEAEAVLWDYLRDRRLENIKIRRQHPIPNTTHIADFFIHDSKLVIELDGSIHADQQEADTSRQQLIESLGYRVIRFRNEQIFSDLETTLAVILNLHYSFTASPAATNSPRPAGEGLGVRATLIELKPDSRSTWLIPENATAYATFLTLGSKETKSAKNSDSKAIFKIYSRGVATSRDDVAYDFNADTLQQRIMHFIENYNGEVDRYRRSNTKDNIDDFVKYDRLKWSRDLKLDLQRGKYAEFSENKLRQSIYRPFTKQTLFFDRILNEEVYVFPSIFPTLSTERENSVICVVNEAQIWLPDSKEKGERNGVESRPGAE